MTHGEVKDLIESISKLYPNLTTKADRINKIVETMGRTNVYANVLADNADRTKNYDPLFRDDNAAITKNIASMEKMLIEKIGFKKVAFPEEKARERYINSNMMKQVIAEEEYAIQFERTNHEQAKKITGTRRYLGVLNSLYGNDLDMQGFHEMTLEQQGELYFKKLNAALEAFPDVMTPDISDTEIKDNYRTILELYNLTFEVNNAREAFMKLPHGSEIVEKCSLLQSNMAVLNARAYLMASPYYAELDFDQILRTPINHDTFVELADHAETFDDVLKSDLNLLKTLKDNLAMCRQEDIDKFLPKAGEGTVEYFGGDGKPMRFEDRNTALGGVVPLLLKVTDRDGKVSVKTILPASPTSLDMEQLTPEQYLDYARGVGRTEIADMASELDQSVSFFRGSSDQFKAMTAALERLYSHNLSNNAATPSTQNLLGSKDVLEELLESANAYLQYKAQSRAGTDTVEDYSKLGKNQYEQDRINKALKLRDYAQFKLNVYNLLEQNSDFVARAATNEEALRNALENSTRKDIANLRAACAQRNPEPWVVREGGDNVKKLHHAVGRDLRRLSELACLDRPLDAIEKTEVRTRMARAVALDLIRSERASRPSDEMGTLERTAAQNPEKFAAGVAKSKPFQKAMDKLTPEALKEMLSGNGIKAIRQGMLNQAVSPEAKPNAPAVEAIVQPPQTNAPKM